MPRRCDPYIVLQIAVLTEVRVERGPLIGGGYGKLDSIWPKFQSIFQCLRHGFTSFTGQPKNEASMDPHSKASAFRHEFLRLPSVQTLAHSLQYIVTSRFKADHEVANPCFLHFSQNIAW